MTSVPAPELKRVGVASPRGCSPEVSAPAVPVAPAQWRLTDRGIAVVLVIAATLAVAAVLVVGLTAMRVTSPTYQPAGVSLLSESAQP